MKFAGSYVALVTPFAANGSVDEETFRRLIGLQIKSGTAGLVPCGTTGEAATLSHEEYRRVIEIAVQEARGRVPVIAGVAANSTAKAVELVREISGLGADAVLLLSPYYNKPTQQGLYEHFRAAASATRLKVIVYNIPGRTAVNILPKTLVRLARDYPNIAAVKEAAGSLDQASEILASAPRGFAVLSGDDNLTLPMMSAGATGVVSVIANIAPRQTAELCRAARKDPEAAARLHLRMFPLVKALFAETNPIPVKAALEMMGLCRGALRLPLTPPEPSTRAQLKAELKAFGLV